MPALSQVPLDTSTHQQLHTLLTFPDSSTQQTVAKLTHCNCFNRRRRLQLPPFTLVRSSQGMEKNLQARAWRRPEVWQSQNSTSLQPLRATSPTALLKPVDDVQMIDDTKQTIPAPPIKASSHTSCHLVY